MKQETSKLNKLEKGHKSTKAAGEFSSAEKGVAPEVPRFTRECQLYHQGPAFGSPWGKMSRVGQDVQNFGFQLGEEYCEMWTACHPGQKPQAARWSPPFSMEVPRRTAGSHGTCRFYTRPCWIPQGPQEGAAGRTEDFFVPFNLEVRQRKSENERARAKELLEGSHGLGIENTSGSGYLKGLQEHPDGEVSWAVTFQAYLSILVNADLDSVMLEQKQSKWLCSTQE
ncbi:uncharacterized protein LOC120516409 [Polypterus senegalus]|uniref:uncharacterized protein LOC120516409 n=1 Tax=Polypterus senegalus TaxID=55291 RepID=UPI001963001D|nr:uncharacterized protein LOC120516409 [Polypterus senegalus]